MPVSEAILHGTKVVCTDTPELREAGRSYATYVECTVESLVEGIKKSFTLPKPEIIPTTAFLNASPIDKIYKFLVSLE